MAARPAACEWDAESILEPPAPAGSAGSAVAVGDGWVAVGAPFATVETRSEQGGVHIYRLTENGAWGFTTTLVSAAGAAYDRFGQALAAQSNRLVIGVWGDDERGTDAGAAHVFETDGTNWAWIAKLTATDGAAGHFFGSAVALDGDALAVGARKAPVGVKTAAGAVYVFDRDGEGVWRQSQKLTADDAVSYDYFGGAVTLDGHEILIGANDNDDNGSKSGSAYLFRFDAGGTEQWEQTALLRDTGGAQYDLMGSSVALRDGLAAVGAPGAFAAAGAVCLYARDEGGGNAWGQVAKVLPADVPAGMGFGGAVCLADSLLFVGAPDATVAGAFASGSVFVYEPAAEGDDWKQVQRLDSAAPGESLRFGYALAADAALLAVGSPGSTNAGERAGAAMLYREAAPTVVITGIAVISNVVHVTWIGGTDFTQIVERASSLQAVGWQPVLTNVPPTLQNGSYAETLEVMNFYRVSEIRP